MAESKRIAGKSRVLKKKGYYSGGRHVSYGEQVRKAVSKGGGGKYWQETCND
jgi:hypothetical protein